MTAVEVNEEGHVDVDEEEQCDSTRTDREFPDGFYDPTTGRLMRDPVVNPAGDSYDRSTLEASSSDIVYYPNRALKSIIDREVELTSRSMRASVRRFDENLHNAWGRLVEKSAFGFEHRPLPESYYCPITCDLMVDPVIDPDGSSYERDAIENWVRANGKSPVTREPLSLSDLRENNALYEVIQEEKNRSDESIHPSIRRWKEAGATSRRRQESDAQPDTAGTTPAPSVAETLPTTQAEIRSRRMRRVQRNQHRGCCVCFVAWVIAMILAIAVSILFPPLVFIGIGVFVVGLVCLCVSPDPSPE